jgi:hypothetical protein
MVDTDIVTETPEPAAPPAPAPINERPVDGPGSGRSNIRKELEKNVEAFRKEPAPEPERRPKAAKTPKSRARQEIEAQEQETPEEQEPAPQEVEGTEPQEPETKAPEGWAKEAKAEWANLPPAVQAAVVKRETDMAKGVDDLKKKYSEIDQALQPRMDVIRRHGHTPAQAVNQLFAWFEALSANPIVAFPALAQSFRFDLKNIPGLAQAQQQPAATQPQEPAKETKPEDIPVGVQTYVKGLEQKIAELQQGFTQQLGQLSSSFQQQSQAKTEEILANWAKDKPHFEDVRRTMAQLIASQTVPPLPNGAADLDRAYDMALWALPEVRAKILEEQRKAEADKAAAKVAAEKKAQQEQADKARRAAGSLSVGAPGSPAQPTGKAKGKSKSVRESIMEARAELADQ